ncbi:hypothetical protein TVAG_166670 [Trichomonas vaginalis G3]|uniref:Golgi apparatus membrane protein TVP23 homolog n=1 Tax=Trichomonas vaginalis (strain ATCC PRA-98 / G3) TaxID=412133 RepID=A2DE74_TRIV3|nr:Golgi APPARATUS membrane protein TVP23 family [Trichomonas vaginalis G3]EAY21292.1 hypothetical protein TVAG_166670 [Trichomonas vaginalis G3]KAI5548866.1 Golgi APPARATUS membrane protein TVP23 family [Trichomonas vaginalis G3]|eukprot:XP_001582278.1 hypothetical protein [Trichomonas vaginalis G3]
MKFGGRGDDLELMNETSRHETDEKRSWILYLGCHILPFVVFFICRLIDLNGILLGLVTLILSLIVIYYTKNNFGWSLVGIKWCFDREKQPDFPYITFTARSLPFVATAFDSNVFWLTLFSTTLLWILVTIRFIYVSGNDLSMFLAVISGINVINVNFFIRCHQVAKTQAEVQARNVLLEACAEFPHITNEDQPDPELPPEEPEQKTSVQIPTAPIPSQIPAKKVEQPIAAPQPQLQSIPQPTVITPPSTPEPQQKTEEPAPEPTFEPSFEPQFDEPKPDEKQEDDAPFAADFGDNQKEEDFKPQFTSFAPAFNDEKDDGEEAVVFGDANDEGDDQSDAEEEEEIVKFD